MINKIGKMFSDLKYKYDSLSLPKSVLDKYPVNEYAKTRSGGYHKTFCYAPSVNMYFAQDGSVKACCHNMEFSIGKYPEQSLKEIWNSEKALELRKLMENYDLSKGCEICAADFRTKDFYEIRARHFDIVPRNAFYPTMMEFLLTNTCNLECIMCKGEFSSLIRKNREKLPPLVSPYNKEFLKQLEEFIPHLHETRFSGSGEAFSIDMNYEIWEMIISLNPKCLIMVQTNGTILSARVKDILSRGNFQIGVSLDSLQKETFEEIRVNANFDKVIDNLNYFNEYAKLKKNKFSISTCVMRQNWRELPDFINYANRLDAIATFHKVWFPEDHSPRTLSKSRLTEIYEYLSKFDFPKDTDYQKTNREHYRYIVSVIKGWMEAANNLEEEITLINALPDEGLEDYFEVKIRNAVYNNKDIEQKTRVAEQCIDKVKVVINRLPNNRKYDMLRHMCASPEAEVLKALLKQSTEALFNDAMAHIIIEEPK